jgi:putative phosphoesterase
MLLNFPISTSYNWLILPNGRRLFLTHGHLFNPQSSELPLSEKDILVFGHTHISLAETINGVRSFNPGSITLPKGGQVTSYGLLKDEKLYVINLDNDEILATLDTAS